MSTIMYLDFETGGLDAKRHAILQAAWIIERDGEVLLERVFDVFPSGDVDFQALAVNNFDFERMSKGKPLSYVLCALKGDLAASIRGSEMIRPCGHYVEFDLDFLVTACKTLHENFSTYLAFNRCLDTVAILRWFDHLGKINLPSHKLEAVCKHYGIEIKAHDALEDVRAVRKLFHLLQP